MLLAVEEKNQRGIVLPDYLAFVPMLLALGLIALVIATLKYVASYREDEFRAVGSSKTMWIILVFVLGWITPVFYFATVHRRLQDGRRQPLT
jgi:ABC-type polysaccharide/polyol phosphate export permease